MKLQWDNIKLIIAVFVLLLLFAFTNNRNADRNVLVDESITFENPENLFVSKQTVNKLLIQKGKHVRNLKKDALVLNKLENILVNHSMVEDAEVYLSVNGKLGIKIKQKTPVARIIGSPSFYIDDKGGKMPWSENYSARVILVSGFVHEENYESVRDLVLFLQEDAFLNKHFVEIKFENKNEVVLLTRSQSYKVKLGKIENINRKFRNYKAFYMKSKKDDLLKKYSIVNLEFNKQVVCTKK